VDVDAVVHRPYNAFVARLVLDNIPAEAAWCLALSVTHRVFDGLQLPIDDSTTQRIAEHVDPIAHRGLLEGQQPHRRFHNGIVALLAGTRTVALVARTRALLECHVEQPILELLGRGRRGEARVPIRVQPDAMILGPFHCQGALRPWLRRRAGLIALHQIIGLARALANALRIHTVHGYSHILLPRGGSHPMDTIAASMARPVKEAYPVARCLAQGAHTRRCCWRWGCRRRRRQKHLGCLGCAHHRHA